MFKKPKGQLEMDRRLLGFWTKWLPKRSATDRSQLRFSWRVIIDQMKAWIWMWTRTTTIKEISNIFDGHSSMGFGSLLDQLVGPSIAELGK